MKRTILHKVVNHAMADDWPKVAQILRDNARTTSWKRETAKFLDFLFTGKPRFSIFVDGNSKEPFLSFSTLATATCPGAGECLTYCYSLKGWRYPAVFLRQLQNMRLEQTPQGKRYIARALAEQLARPKYRKLTTVPFRLNVDGDFPDVWVLRFWLDLIWRYPQLEAYGYSKSLLEFIELADTGYQFPSNYLLNISSGSCHDDITIAIARGLECTRGDYVTVEIDSREAKKDAKRYASAVRRAMGQRVFVCPGKCGDCTPKGHACGLAAFRGVTIGIARH